MVQYEKYEYSGRIDDPAKKERIHQWIKPSDEANAGDYVIIGFQSDEGVKRNKGRLGAKLGPIHIRKKLASLSYHQPIYDYGNIIGTENLSDSQRALGNIVTETFNKQQFPIILGGGHETLYGHYLGVRGAFKDASIAVVNFDAHFDLRNEAPSSGTMFHQILSEDENIDYFVFGIQAASNTQTLFDTADHFGVIYVLMDDLRTNDSFSNYIEVLSQYDYVFVTLCMDSVQQSVAPGTSAPAANGYSALEIHELFKEICKLKNLISIDISEVSPELDIDDRTSGLAASLIHTFLTHRPK